jgi:hypothetical protein
MRQVEYWTENPLEKSASNNEQANVTESEESGGSQEENNESGFRL